jgi:hypothetical protein
VFEYFPNNYVWNLSVDIALESGAQIGEIDLMCRPLRVHDLVATYDTERWAAKVVDYLEMRREVDPARIGKIEDL